MISPDLRRSNTDERTRWGDRHVVIIHILFRRRHRKEICAKLDDLPHSPKVRANGEALIIQLDTTQGRNESVL